MDEILIIEDDEEISEMLATVLKKDYQITRAFSGTEGLLQLSIREFQLVILDVMLPGKTGLEVLSEIRGDSTIPVIMLTALSDKETTVEFLLQGANDYITKPFNIQELQARIQVQLRNYSSKKNEKKTKKFKNMELFYQLYSVKVKGQELFFSKKEFEILSLLIDHPKQIFTKDMLYEKIWNEAYFGDENTVNVHISNIRKKIQKVDSETKYIDTVWGIGIKLAADDSESEGG